MKLKGIKSIALFMVAVLLLTTPLAAMAAPGAENRNSGERFRSDEGWRMDARYWWEVPPLTPYQRQQVKEIMTLVLDRYFGVDVSAMSPEEFEEVAKSLGPEKEWEALRLFGYYAQKRGFEVPAGIFDAPPGFEEPPGIPPRLETSPEEYTPKRLYWWEAMGYYTEEEIEKEITRIAEESGMSPDEIRARLNELFPGVDLREMTFEEYAYFLNSLPSIKPACLEEAKQCPTTIAVFGKMPPLPTQEALREFAEKLEVVVEEVIEPASSPVRDLMECTILFTVTYEGVIRINVCGSHVAQADKIYEIISQRAKSLFGIEDVPVVISGGWRFETFELPLHVEVVSDREPLASSWPPPPPYGDFYRPIVGGIAKTALCQHARWNAGSTIGFAVVERRRWWCDNEDYVVTGHLGSRITPVNTQIYQPSIAAGNEAGRVVDTVGVRTFADVARVGIADRDVAPYIHIDCGVLRPVTFAGDPGVDQRVWMSGAASGQVLRGTVARTGVDLQYHPFRQLYDQVLVRGMAPIPGDSGAPLFTPVGIRDEVKILGLLSAGRYTNGVLVYSIFSPTSGVERELGVEVWRR